MSDTKRLRKQFFVITIGLLLMIGQFSVPLQSIAYAATTQGETVLAFTSDVHNDQKNYTGETRLGTWIDNVTSRYNKIDAMALGGDMAQYNSADAKFWSETQRVMDVVEGKGIAAYYTTGNHEYDHDSSISNDFYPDKNEVTQKYIQNNWAVENGSNYRLYCMGVGEASGYTFVNNAYTENQVTTLRDKLAAVDNSKPIFIITHFPLHYTAQSNSSSSRTITRASDIIDTLNTAANGGTPDDPSDDKRIIFVWGHNHSMNSPNDTHYDRIYQKGSSLQYDSSHSKELEFIYASAGAMCDTEKDAGSGKIDGKGLVATINNNNQISLSYHKADGTTVTKNDGPYEEKDPVAVENLTIDEAAGAGQDGIDVEAGRRLQLHATIEPSDATDTSVTWSSDDTTVATVDSSGKVKGVAEGQATITASLTDSVSGEEFTATVKVNVTPRTSSGTPYVLTNTLTPGKNYLIVSADSGDAYALMNDNGVISKEEVTIDGDTIYTDNENIVFEAQGSGTTIDDLHNADHYLKAHSTGLELLDVAGTTRPWEYNNSNHSLRNYKSGSNPSYYYVYYADNAFTTVKGTVHEVYIFEEAEIPEDVTCNVTFQVENGKWNDGTSEEKTVVLTGPSGTELKLDADQIPAVGEKPNTHYEAGAWDVIPDTDTAITGNTIYKYTYGYADHVWDEGEVTTQPTCTAKGVKTFSCKNCDATRTEDINALGHNMTAHPAVEATCTEAGNSKYYSCDRCHKFFSDEMGLIEMEEGAWIIQGGHDWDEGKVTKEATTTSTGIMTYTCKVCDATKTESIPKKPESIPEKPESNPKKPENISGKTESNPKKAETIPKNTKGVKPIIVAKAVSKGKRAFNFTWNKVPGAHRYVVYLSFCSTKGKSNKLKKIATVKAGKLTYRKTKLKIRFSYKFRVLAQKKVNGKFKTIAKSPIGHVFSSGYKGRFTNPKSIKVNKAKVTLKKCKTFKIKVTVKKLKPRKKMMQKSHGAIVRYLTSNSSIAIVSKAGKITAKAKGTCDIYAITQNGIWKKIKVSVK